MEQIDVQDAKMQLSRLLERVEAGEEIVLAANGSPIARLVPVEKSTPRVAGLLGGALDEALFETLPEEELRAWEGR